MDKQGILDEMAATWAYVSAAAQPAAGTTLEDGAKVYGYLVRERNGTEERSHIQQIVVYNEGLGVLEEAFYWGERRTPVKKTHDFVDFMRGVLDNNYGDLIPGTNVPTRGYALLALSTRYESCIFMALDGPVDGPYTAKFYYAHRTDADLDIGEVANLDPDWLRGAVYGTPVELQ